MSLSQLFLFILGFFYTILIANVLKKNRPHVLPPSTILTAHLHPSLTSHQSQLNARLQTTQSQNALLYEDVKRQREEIDALLKHLEAAVGDVDGANAALDGLIEELSKEAREAEGDIAMAGDA